ncbi:MAG TPA: hypothetical protein VMJ65_12995 [Solirubrobacteraceae bacterium]|nr:hypothetical protein [Solirubrobacteraceae bacterium]
MTTLEAHGLRIELPRGWSGRAFKRSAGGATLHAGDFDLPLDDGEFGDQSTAVMPSGATFLALTEYRAGGGLEPGKGLFAPRRIPTTLDPTSFSPRTMAHPRPGRVGAQQFFTAATRPFCLYVVVSGVRTERRRQLATLGVVLGSLRIS